MAIEIFHFIHPWHEDKVLGRVMAATRETWRFGRGPTSKSHIHFQERQKTKPEKRAKKHTEDCRVGGEDWLVQNFELNGDFTFVNY